MKIYVSHFLSENKNRHDGFSRSLESDRGSYFDNGGHTFQISVVFGRTAAALFPVPISGGVLRAAYDVPEEHLNY